MKRLVLILAAVCVSGASLSTADTEVAGWEQQAQRVTIIRDKWGIPHVYGKTDADAVFGVMYAQAEDDFNRVETNYLNSMGRLAEAEGESEVYRDLRMKIFINPDDMKAEYEKSPAWLKALMNAYADGLNYYLHTHPKVTPRVIKRFEPWMTLTFTEGSISKEQVDFIRETFARTDPDAVRVLVTHHPLFAVPVGESAGRAIGGQEPALESVEVVK